MHQLGGALGLGWMYSAVVCQRIKAMVDLIRGTNVASKTTVLNMEDMKILITGGCGFIGATAVARFFGCGACVRVLDNMSVGKINDIPVANKELETGYDPNIWSSEYVQVVIGDILEAEVVLQASTGADAIVHLAANTGVAISIEDPREDCLTNVVGTLNVLEAARSAGVLRVIFASSGAPAGEVTPPIHEEIVPRPISPYGASKLAGEAYCNAYWRSFGVEATALRFGNVYGPGSSRKTSVVATFSRCVQRGEPLVLHGDGSQTRDFIYIGDLVEAIAKALTTPDIGGEIFQIATSLETSIQEIASAVQRACERHGVRWPGIINGPQRVGDVPRNYSDTSKAERVLGWKASHSLDDGVAATLAMFINNTVAAD